MIEQTSANAITESRYAGFWLRFGALLIDLIVWVVLALLSDLILSSIYGYRVGLLTDFEAELTVGDEVSVIIWLIIWFLYFTIMESSSMQATIGKWSLNLKVTDFSGERITFLRAVGRYFGKILSFLTLMIGFMMAGWTKNKQGLHDKVARTLVNVEHPNSLSGEIVEQVSSTISNPRYAGFWRRFGAVIIDSIFLAAVFFSIEAIASLIVGAPLGSFRFLNSDWMILDRALEVVIALVTFLYFTVFESSRKQATLGKSVFNLKVTDCWGNRIKFMRAVVRYIGHYISAIILLIGYLMVIWTKKKQGLHDKMAGTLVIVDRMDSD